MSKPNNSAPIREGEANPKPHASVLCDLQMAVVEAVSANVPWAVATILQGVLEGLRRRKEAILGTCGHSIERRDRWHKVSGLLTLAEATRDAAKRLEI